MSDNYMILHALLTGERAPKVVVLGLAMRDFMDNEVPCAAATPAFKYLERYTDVGEIVGLAMPEIWQRQEFWLKRRLYLLDKKLDIEAALSQFAQLKLRSNLEQGSGDCRLNQFDMSCYVPSLRSEVERNVWISRPHVLEPQQDNTLEYKRRYRTPNDKLFRSQEAFLRRFLTESEARGINVILVNLPVTPDHLTLMPPASYDRYKATLERTANRFHVPFIDLDGDPAFVASDFRDSCHMRASGGKKLLDRIARAARDNQEIATSLEITKNNSQFESTRSTIY